MRNKQELLLSVLALTVFLCASSSLSAQAIKPDPAEDHPTLDDTGCLGTATAITQGDGLGNHITFETYITSAINLSPLAATATMPLHKGVDSNGNFVYYIMTDTSDCDTAKSLGINYVPKLGLLINGTGIPVNQSVQQVTVDSAGMLHFVGTAFFKNAAPPHGPNVRVFVPSKRRTPNPLDPVDEGETQGSPMQGFPAQGFPTSTNGFAPGSVGDANYSPLITYKNAAGKNIVINAPQVANETGVKDFIPAIDFSNMTVTFNLVRGIYNFHFVMYLRMDASDPLISAFEGGIFAPNLQQIPINGDRFFKDGSSRQTILPILNGIRGVDKIFDRQGVQSAALGEGDPLNIVGAKPGEQEYSPMWDLTPVVWTPFAVGEGKRQRLHQDDEVASFIGAGGLGQLIESWAPAGGAANADFGGLKSLNIVSNCPIMLRILRGLPAYEGGK